ncbi:iron complex outermembrane receptor protein [Novosphingobium kunmingense]|uniref:Iron complex outermembrane receptor protein n=1 Tax=Novosphingobium kunmingense TaxID=1211806 RepID=A0A2N0I120_9SPHN|nr:TonB-dependent receptor [Novosphingobium kunmingense]PKB24890.1 iron complex outermembrane receptor protein [Novosphingobium kunmingense]
MIVRKLLRAACLGGISLGALAGAAQAQDISTPDTAQADDKDGIVVTGSRIRQDPAKSALPLQIVTPDDLSREGISNPEQLISFLASNGNGADNLASNSDVISGAGRGANGLSSANLRGQGPSSTLVLLNGRRVAAHGLSGAAVDVNQVPLAAIERVEILKDGASAIYGTDAIGGVINFITKKNFRGIDLTGFYDITEEGDSPMRRLSGTVGFGDLDNQGFNVMASVSKSWNGALFGKDRDFVNGNQPSRGLSIDTRGTPIATAFPLNPPATGIGITGGGTLLGNTTGTLTNLTVNGVRMNGGVNVLDLPGGAGCDSMAGGMAYDEVLWVTPGAALACAWDTGRAVTLQQPIDTLTYYGRATARLGDHELFAEVTGSKAHSSKLFSNNQYSANNTSLPIAYPLNSLTAATYNDIYDRLAAVLPGLGAVGDRTVDANGRYGLPIAYRWRCVACGNREYTTDTKTFRAAIGLEGPITDNWEYRIGGGYAESQATSILGSGYHYRGVFPSNAAAVASGTGATLAGQADPRAPTAPGATAPGIVGLLNSGILNPFSIVQTPQALAALEAVSAKGTRLYGGKYTLWQADAAVTGDLFELPGGTVKIAVGADYRREGYGFDGSVAGDQLRSPDIFNVAFDNANQFSKVTRDVKAAYAEVLVPVIDSFEITGAVRVDDYTGFGSTVNPKVTAKFEPVDWLMIRGSYGTGFRVPTFNQIFNGVTQTPNPGGGLTDPTTCPAGGSVNVTPGCNQINPDSINGGNRNLGPETSEQFSAGIVLRPTSRFSLSADYWNIAVDNVIGSITLTQLFANIAAFPERIERTNGIITLVDLRTGNFGSRRTSGIDFSGRAAFDAAAGTLSAGFDGTLLLTKKEKLLPNLPYTNLRGVYSLTGDIGIKWKHNAWISFTKDDFTLSFSQIYRGGYANGWLPRITSPNVSATRPDYNDRVKAYHIYNLSATQRIDENFQLTLGVRNLFNADPPFAITYDTDTGTGSSWEPRVADPRGRSFTVAAEVKF